MKFEVVLSPKATKDLDKLNDKTCQHIVGALDKLTENPFPRGELVRKLKGFGSDYYRLRINKYRVFYMIDDNKVAILRVFAKKDAKRFIGRLPE